MLALLLLTTWLLLQLRLTGRLRRLLLSEPIAVWRRILPTANVVASHNQAETINRAAERDFEILKTKHTNIARKKTDEEKITQGGKNNNNKPICGLKLLPVHPIYRIICFNNCELPEHESNVAFNDRVNKWNQLNEY